MDSLKDFTFVLTDRVRALELLVQDQAREIAVLTEGHGRTAPMRSRLVPRMQLGSTVSMHGSSAVSRTTTVEVEETETESTTEIEAESA